MKQRHLSACTILSCRLMVVALASSCVASAGQASPPAVKEFDDGCRQESFSLSSTLLGRDVPVVVLVPPNASTKPLPVLYALHGRNAACASFSEMPPLRKYLVDHPMLVVAFQADQDSAYIDATQRKQSRFTTFFFDELLKEIATRYSVTDGRAVTGFSMGGYGAFHYLISRPDAFSSASSMSGAFELFDPEGGDSIRTGFTSWLEQLVGSRETDPSAWYAYRLSPRFEKFVTSGGKLPPLLLLCGVEDFLKPSNRRFVDFLGSLNKPKPTHPVRFEYCESPGTHDWAYWRDHIQKVAAFHWQNFPSNQ